MDFKLWVAVSPETAGLGPIGYMGSGQKLGFEKVQMQPGFSGMGQKFLELQCRNVFFKRI